MNDFRAGIRGELTDEYRVFFVTAWGYAADHLFGWFPKALNSHRDIFALLAHEGSRPKYLKERTRGERPALIPYTEFLNDMGMTYSVIGDCYSYRAGQMPELLNIDRYKNIPVVNLVRHPFPWLEFYVRWRASNMRMREGSADPLAWEWKVACHAYFEYLSLRSYEKEEVEVWAAYQGMFQINNVLGDVSAITRHLPVEKVAEDPALFGDVVGYLCRGTVEMNKTDIDRAYSTRNTLFRGEEKIETDPRSLLDSWPGWKVDAFRKLVKPEALDAYKTFGYDLLGIEHKPTTRVMLSTKVERPIFVCTVMKSGTWLLRAILAMMTELKPYEPEIKPEIGAPDYENENLIDFPKGYFFSWHSTLTGRSVALLRGCQAKNIFLIRNVYDLILAIYNHLSGDVDSGIGRSVSGGDYFTGKTVEQSLTLIIAGFTCPRLTWRGVAPIIKQIASMLELVESGQALMLTYEELTDNKPAVLEKLARYLEIQLTQDRLDEIVVETSIDKMRENLRPMGKHKHVTSPEKKLYRDVFFRYHKDMIDQAVHEYAPSLPERLSSLGIDWIFRLEKDIDENVGVENGIPPE